MILQSLDSLYDRLKDDPAYRIPRPGWSLQKIAFKVVLRTDGSLFDIQDVRTADGKRFVPRLMLVPGSGKPSGTGINPGLLWDNPAYMLGFKVEDRDPDRTRRSFEAFRQRHLDLVETVESTALTAVCAFLKGWDPARAADYAVLSEVTAGFGVFQILGETAYVHQDPAVQAVADSVEAEAPALPAGQCLVSGETGPIARIHEPLIKGVRGAQGSGAVLVGFNERSYESYGKSQSLNSPVSPTASFRYCVALNALLGGPMSEKHRLLLGDSTVVFWTDAPSLIEDVFAVFASERGDSAGPGDAQDEELREKLALFLKAIRRGVQAYGELGANPESTRFFLLGLSPNAARISVRFFHRSSVAELVENLRKHYEDIGIERRWGDEARHPDPEFPSLQALLDQTCPPKSGRPDREKVPPILSGPLLRAILEGTPYPNALFSAVLRRLRTDRTMTYLRACMIKGHLKRNLKLEVSMSLDRERPDPAYRLGRLFAALERTQRDAHDGKLERTIRESFYSSASATPRSVFPRLLRTYQHHLAKLEGGRKVNREKLVQEILSPLTDLASHLDLAGQGLFAPGYYHQTNDFYTKNED